MKSNVPNAPKCAVLLMHLWYRSDLQVKMNAATDRPAAQSVWSEDVSSSKPLAFRHRDITEASPATFQKL
eukprot:365474-Chlamydomonas_euryale.AAC.7